ncbi:acyltransferase family protein [Mycobacterium sp. MS1601]|uniref:acyltransferase family protein n=1 Tax=Mycobacterium sp. MS1601 TaxID=1936029 RepID=UPI001F30187A|nr:acyltransferase family protein [Mycobacterium sp. MS1601]
MVAVLVVFANHLWGWPHGGFVGVDVFFVISGFLITGNLLRDAQARGTVSFKRFYWNRVRRIVPAATLVLLLTYLAAVVVFLPFRSQQVGVDALFAFVFLANWNFAIQDTDYFQEGNALSPIQHYWSLSIEEQFYFVWPALIFLISALVLHRAWTHSHRIQMAAAIMGLIVAASFVWAMYQTSTAPAWAYFDTLTRVWELGVGALLATAVGLLGRIPAAIKPALSWTGLGLIAASLFLIGEDSAGFPAPWALLPVTGAALVIVAGVNGEPRFQGFLRNPVSTYIGDISYSLYLVHWPVIVILAAIMDVGTPFYVIALALAFGFAIASYHLVENPLRRADWATLRRSIRAIRHQQYESNPATKHAAVASAALVTLALCVFALQPLKASDQTELVTVAANNSIGNPLEASAPEVPLGPLGADLQNQILAAVQATSWPVLNPTMEATITGPQAPPEVARCSRTVDNDPSECTWGMSTAPIKVVIVGSSIAVTYSGPMRDIALNSGGQLQVHTEAMFGCAFVDAAIQNTDEEEAGDCAAKKQRAIDVIVASRPQVVVISNSYKAAVSAETGRDMSPAQWSQSMRAIVEKISGSTNKIVFMAAPPADVKLTECYGNRSSTPQDCLSRVTSEWNGIAQAEQNLAESFNSTWIDSRPWFCTSANVCPSFVGSTPTKVDDKHMSPAYGQKITPVMLETLIAAGVFPAPA